MFDVVKIGEIDNSQMIDRPILGCEINKSWVGTGCQKKNAVQDNFTEIPKIMVCLSSSTRITISL